MKKLFLMLIGVLMLSACSGDVDTFKIAEIEQMIAANDYEAAQSVCDNIVEDEDLSAVQVRDLCKLSICFAKLSDRQQQEENMAKAAKCYKAAMEQNADSVNAIMAELPVEDVQYAMLLKNLSGLMGAPIDIEAEEPADSECIGDCDKCTTKCDKSDAVETSESDKTAKVENSKENKQSPKKDSKEKKKTSPKTKKDE